MVLPKSRTSAAVAVGAALAVAVTPLPAAAAEKPWQVTSASLPQISRLQDVTATGPSDAWVVGYQNTRYFPQPDGVQLYAVQRWNGRTWSQQQLPDNPVDLTGVSASSATDVWTVGVGRGSVPYAARFDGSRWTGYRPAGADNRTVLRDVAAHDGKAVFVGTRFPDPEVVEWDGKQFTHVAVTGPGTWANELLSVSTAPDGATFAVGARYDAGGSVSSPLVLHRRGTAWQVASVPNVANARLVSVSARSATDVWAVGTIDDSYTRKPIILHYDGQSWRQVAAPVPAATLQAVAVDTAGTVWITGGQDNGTTLYLRYRGDRWTTEYGTQFSPASGTPSIQGLTAVPGAAGGFWGVGAVWEAREGAIAVIGRRT